MFDHNLSYYLTMCPTASAAMIVPSRTAEKMPSVMERPSRKAKTKLKGICRAMLTSCPFKPCLCSTKHCMKIIITLMMNVYVPTVHAVFLLIIVVCSVAIDSHHHTFIYGIQRRLISVINPFSIVTRVFSWKKSGLLSFIFSM